MDRILAERPELADALKHERALALAALRQALRGNPSLPYYASAGPHSLPDQVRDAGVRLFYPKMRAYAAASAYYRKSIEEASKPYWQRTHLWPAIELYAEEVTVNTYRLNASGPSLADEAFHLTVVCP